VIDAVRSHAPGFIYDGLAAAGGGRGDGLDRASEGFRS
jgi:hypothetical protein